MSQTLLPPQEDYQEKREKIERYEDETRARRRAWEQKLDSLFSEREACQKAACDHAGNIGLVYDAVENNYYRIVATIESVEKPPLPAAPVRPQPLERPKVTRENSGTYSGVSKTLKAIGYVLGVPVGAFIGFGLTTLTGLPYQREIGYLVAGLAIGVAVILALKLLFETMWAHYGREKALQKSEAGIFWTFLAITGALTFAEAWLGAQALVIYTSKVGFDQSDALTTPLALPLAVAISTATLLISAIGGYVAGYESLARESDALREHERQENERQSEAARVDADHAKEIARWETEKTEAQAAYETAKERIEAEKQEMEHYRKSADYQALLKYIGRINTLNKVIPETEEMMRDDKISRGYERASIK